MVRLSFVPSLLAVFVLFFTATFAAPVPVANQRRDLFSGTVSSPSALSSSKHVNKVLRRHILKVHTLSDDGFMVLSLTCFQLASVTAAGRVSILIG